MKKLKIVFSTNNTNHAWRGLEDEPLGGAWYVTLSIAKHLASYGHKVYSFHNTPVTNSRGEQIDKVRMIHRKWLKHFLKHNKVDIFIGEREVPVVRKDYNIKVFCYHVHNTPQAEHPGKLREYLKIGAVDKIIFVSNWMKELVKDQYVKDNIYVIPNGTNLYPVTGEKKNNRLLWASNPSRGLPIVINDIFPEVKKIIPDIELHIAGSHSIYNYSPGNADKKDKGIYHLTFKDNKWNSGQWKEGVWWHGALSQWELAKFFNAGTLLIFPLTNRSETGSIVTVQALSYLTPAIVRRYCVLPELVGVNNERGICIRSLDSNDEWVKNIVWLLNNKERYEKMQANCLKWREKYEWRNIVKKVNQDFLRWCK